MADIIENNSPPASIRIIDAEKLIVWILGWSFVLFCIFDYHVGNFLGISLILSEAILLAIFFATILWALHTGKVKSDVYMLILSVLGLSISGAILYHPFWGLVGGVFLLKSYIAFVMGMILFRSQKNISDILQFIYVLGLISATVSIVGYFVELGPLNSLLGIDPSRAGAIGIFDNANKNAQFMIISIAAVFLLGKRSFIKYLAINLFVMTIFLSGSRQALLALLIFFVTLILFHPGTTKKKKTLLMVMFLGFTMVLIVFFGNTLFSRFAEVSRIAGGGAYFRLEAGLISLKIFLDNPLFGSGPGSFGGAVANISNSPLHDKTNLFAHWVDYEGRPDTIDMFWPHFWAESGLFGLAIYLSFISKLVIRLYKIASTDKKAIYFTSLLFSILFMGFLSFILETSFIGLVFFALCGGWINNQWVTKEKL